MEINYNEEGENEELADRVGFEPTVHFRVRRFSRPVP